MDTYKVNVLTELSQEFETKINSKRILVFAGSREEFDIFVKARTQEFKLKGLWEGYEYLYLYNQDCHRGQRINELILHGMYFLRDEIDLNQIYPLIRG